MTLLLQSIEAWERAVLTYNQQSKETIPEAILTSVLCNGIKNDKIREHITLNASRLVKYQDVRDEIVRISMASRHWTLTAESGSVPVPMEIGAVQQKGGKGKSKGKKGLEKTGKGPQEPKGGTAEETRECWYCGKLGHLSTDCRKKARDERPKGGKGKNSGKKGPAAAVQEAHGWEALETPPPPIPRQMPVPAAAVQQQWSLQSLADGAALLANQALQQRQSARTLQLSAIGRRSGQTPTANRAST